MDKIRFAERIQRERIKIYNVSFRSDVQSIYVLEPLPPTDLQNYMNCNPFPKISVHPQH